MINFSSIIIIGNDPTRSSLIIYPLPLLLYSLAFINAFIIPVPNLNKA